MPTAAIREHALRVARLHTRLPVASGVEVRPDAGRSAEHLPADAVRQGAVEVLSRGFGMTSRGWEIRAEDDGRVVVNGSSNSVEEKLAVSRTLRRVRGCTGVGNHLMVSPMMRAGRMVTLVTADGALTIPGMVTNLEGTGQEAPAPVPPRSAPAPEAAPVTGTVLWKPATPAPSAVPHSPYAGNSEPPRPVVTRSAPPDAPAASWTPPPPSDGLALPRVMPSFETGSGVAPTQYAPSPYAGTVQAAAMPAVKKPASVPARAAKTPAPADENVDLLSTPEVPSSWSRTEEKGKNKTSGSIAVARPDLERQMTADQLLGRPAEKPAAGTNSAPATVRASGTASAWTATTPPPPAEKPTRTLPAVPKPAPVTRVGHRIETSGPVVAEAVPHVAPPKRPEAGPTTWMPYIHALAAAHSHILPPILRVPEPPGGWQPAHVSTPPAAPAADKLGALAAPSTGAQARSVTKPAGPHVTHGKLIFAENYLEEGKSAGVQQTGHKVKSDGAAPSGLKKKVEAACGPEARGVRVTVGPDKVTRVEIKVVSNAAVNSVTEKVLRLPEVTAPNVRLDVTVGP